MHERVGVLIGVSPPDKTPDSLPDGSEWTPATRIDSGLVQAVVRAHRWREMLETGEYVTAADLAKAEKVNDDAHHRRRLADLLLPAAWGTHS
jgi:hypothetical protein